MPTTTFEAIRDQMITKLEAITPAILAAPGQEFRRVGRRFRLREWAAGNPDGAFRKFEIMRSGIAEEPPFMDPSVFELNEAAAITVAYPRTVGLYGQGDLFNGVAAA